VQASAIKVDAAETGAPGMGAGLVGSGVGSAGGSLISARKLSKVYGSGASAITILNSVDLEVKAGEMIAVVGPSGAGKSTFLHLLAALDTPTSGTVYFREKLLETREDTAIAEFRNRQIGFVWQRHHLLADFTAAENVAMPVLMRSGNPSEALERAGRWLEEVGLASRAKHRAAELSGGEQQRVAIARALVNEPAVLLADEPTGDLDEQNATVIMDLIERLHRTHRLTSILATHNSVLAKRCDRVLQLEHGALRPNAAFQQAPALATEGEKS
jgi:lipoprotein-releasing system ATP-binding protein